MDTRWDFWKAKIGFIKESKWYFNPKENSNISASFYPKRKEPKFLESEPKSDGRCFFFFFFWKVKIEFIKKSKWYSNPSENSNISARFYPKGREPRFLELNPKVTEGFFFFFENFFFFKKISNGLIKEKKWPTPDPNANSNLFASFYSKGKGSKFLKFEFKSKKSGFFFSCWKIFNGLIKEKKWPIPDPNANSNISASFIRKENDQSLSNLNPKSKKSDFFFFF